MKTRIQKKEELKSLEKKLPSSRLTVFTSFSPKGEKGLSVAQVQALKRLLREMHSEYVVTKKTLIDIALKDLKYDGIDVFGMEGSVGLVLGDDDPYVVAKKIYEFSRKNQALKFFGAIFEGGVISKERFMELAKMPSKEVLLGRLVMMLMYPIKGLAIALSEISKKK